MLEVTSDSEATSMLTSNTDIDCMCFLGFDAWKEFCLNFQSRIQSQLVLIVSRRHTTQFDESQSVKISVLYKNNQYHQTVSLDVCWLYLIHVALMEGKQSTYNESLSLIFHVTLWTQQSFTYSSYSSLRIFRFPTDIWQKGLNSPTFISLLAPAPAPTIRACPSLPLLDGSLIFRCDIVGMLHQTLWLVPMQLITECLRDAQNVFVQKSFLPRIHPIAVNQCKSI